MSWGKNPLSIAVGREGVGVFRPRNVQVSAASPVGGDRLVELSLQQSANAKMAQAMDLDPPTVGR